jgi:hypothetical protein
VDYVRSNRAMAEIAECYALMLAMGMHVSGHELIEQVCSRGEA